MQEPIVPSIAHIIAQSSVRQQQIMEELHALQLPEELQHFAEAYEKISWSRNRFLWHWVWHLTYARNPGFMLSSVPETDRKTVALIKALLVMAVTIVDDVADKLHDRDLLDVMLKIPFGNHALPDHFDGMRYFAINLLNELLDTAFNLLRKAPCWQANEEIFMYDMKQVWNAFDYADMLHRHPEIINHSENSVYSAHNMMFYLFGGVDLAFSPAVERKTEYTSLREIFWYAQQMTRIGNWVTTWERELGEKDVSSGVLNWGISQGVLTIDEILASTEVHATTCQKINALNIEAGLFESWSNCRDIVLKIGQKVQSVGIPDYVAGLDLVMLYHLASKGSK
ncbi:MAG: hypothetical protein AAF564_03080 [Bacteroidota bacterium]